MKEDKAYQGAGFSGTRVGEPNRQESGGTAPVAPSPSCQTCGSPLYQFPDGQVWCTRCKAAIDTVAGASNDLRIVVRVALAVIGLAMVLYSLGAFDAWLMVNLQLKPLLHNCTYVQNQFTGKYVGARCDGPLGNTVGVDGEANSSQPAADSQAAPQQERNAYPPSVIQNFMDSCTATGGSQDSCSCAITRIQQRYTLSDFTNMEQAYSATGIMDSNLTSIAAACRSY
jgi:hypothetical protein